MLAGHIMVLGGPHVARGPDVAQACSKSRFLQSSLTLMRLSSKPQKDYQRLREIKVAEKLIIKILWQFPEEILMTNYHAKLHVQQIVDNKSQKMGQKKC